MSDTAKVFGITYTGVAGIKVSDGNSGILTYIRPQGTKTISSNGTGIDVSEYAAVDVSVSGGEINLQAKTNISPTTSSQTITADSGYDGLSSVQINRIPTNYITTDDADATSSDILSGKTAYVNGSKITGEIYSSQNVICVPTGNIDETTLPTAYLVEGVEVDEGKPFYTSNGKIVLYTPKSMFGTAMAADVLESKTFSSQNGLGVQGTIEEKSSIDLTASGATVTVPAGYYASAASKSVASGTAGTPTASKGTVSNHQVSITPSVTNTTGYITGSTKTGTAVTVTASELASGNKAIVDNGTNIDVVGYSTVSVAVPFSTITTSSSDPSGGNDGDIWIKVTT